MPERFDALAEAIDATFEEPDLKVCKFEFDGTKYKAKLTSFQCQAVQDAYNAATDSKQIQAVVNELLGDLSLQANNAFDGLTAQLGNPTSAVRDIPGTPPTGCCVYDGGKIANLTEARCQVFQPISWGAPADCSSSEK